eukprot:gnl/MRDRNA2_/MRDRNA2_34269_c0_seq1.p1 gnl/MRDRNA2_/MRDRNA2_34269_c0~~gnl/MRDRNA2_/MRDRNA2_34269_c0_seq1.p1  ORF type:complete len:363 (+),score=51.79 gnl/MRDRNA2_/MRDRNA2_34269_c0_seq1:59-1147(+)
MWKSPVHILSGLLLFKFVSAEPRNIWSVGQHQGSVDVIDASEGLQALPSGSEFFQKYMKAKDGWGTPVMFKGAARHMPAFTKWETDEQIASLYGNERMDQVETEKLETRTKYPHENWNVAKFIKNYKTQTVYSTSETPKGMRKDIWFLPPFNCGGFTRGLATTVLWWSSGSTESVIHNDGQNNQHCMISGSKNWILWHPKAGISSPKMGWVHAEEEAAKGHKEFKDAYGAYVGRVDVHDMDKTLTKFPGWDKLQWWNMTISAGDCAYIPPKWFHFVESPAQRSISVHIWFHAPNKYTDKSCKQLTDRGYDITQPIFSLGDCTFGHGDEEKLGSKPTKCKLPKGKDAPQNPQKPIEEAQSNEL